MISISLKIVDEGLTPNIDDLTEFLSAQLHADDIRLADNADLTLKIKFTVDNAQEKILIQLRETNTKVKIGEKVIHYFPKTWVEDTTSESHALVASLAHVES